MIRRLLVKATPLGLSHFLEGILLKSYKLSKNFLAYSDPKVMELLSEKKALAIFKKAAKTIPAYKQFLREQKIRPYFIRSIKQFHNKLPQTTKNNYVKKNKFEDLCYYGRLPDEGIIEESSGSSGHPTNWIKSLGEDNTLQQGVKFEAEYLFKLSNRQSIIISCWSPGPWTTDLKFCEFFEHVGIVKNTGPDINRVVDVIKEFGPKYHYLIAGYPPFCKILFDQTKRKVDWKKYEVDVCVGGEGFVFGYKQHIRDIVGEKSRIFSGYGASDLDIGVAFETPFSSFIRDLLPQRKGLASRISLPGRIPMVFQYNPLAHYIENCETVDKHGKKTSEFTVTLLDPEASAPKVKYNIHDEGKQIPYNEMIDLLEKYGGPKVKRFMNSKHSDILHLPFLVVYGRSDGTISINGTNIYPSQVEMALMKDTTLTKKVHTFKINAAGKKGARLVLRLELEKGVKPSPSLSKKIEKSFVKHLRIISQEYAQALREFPKQFSPLVELHPYNTGSFKGSHSKIKQKYIG